jgi:predicted ABC-type ATPase
MRMFAGPNGSGKSTLKSVLRKELLGIYLNPDDIEQEIRRQGFLELSAYGVAATGSEALSFFRNSPFLNSAGLAAATGRISFDKNRLVFSSLDVNAYFASVTVDFLRSRLLQQKTSFTLETVMSHRSKIEWLIQARKSEFRTYLYFVATDDSAINISRVRNRVSQGGHAVPEDKIECRYHRSLDLLMDAIRCTNRAYIFDNSGDNQEKHTWLAEITEGRKLEMKTDQMPAWFKRAVLDKADG